MIVPKEIDNETIILVNLKKTLNIHTSYMFKKQLRILDWIKSLYAFSSSGKAVDFESLLDPRFSLLQVDDPCNEWME